MVNNVHSQKKKGSKQVQKSLVSENLLKYFRVGIIAALLLVLFYPPFLRGLFFEAEMLPTATYVFIIFILFWVYKILKSDKMFLQTPIEYAAFGFVVVYFLSMIFSVAMRQAFSEWLKYCMFFAVFYMISDIINTYRSRLLIMWTIIASALGVCIIGIDGAAGAKFSGQLNTLFKFFGAKNDIFFGLFVGERINSTFQYPNALAAYLIAVYFICLSLIIVNKNYIGKVISAIASYVILITFILTLSRGAYIFMPIAAVIFIICLPSGSRVKGVLSALPSLGAVAITVSKLTNFMANAAGNELNMWLYVSLGIVISKGLLILVEFLSKVFKNIQEANPKANKKLSKVTIILLCIIAILSVGFGVIAITAKVPLELAHGQDQADSDISVRRSLNLEQGKEYKLVFDVDAQNASNKPNAFSVNIASRNFEGIIREIDTSLAVLDGKATNGVEQKEITFKVPADGRTVSFTFRNFYQGTKAVFHNAKVVPVDGSKGAIELGLKYKFIPETFVSRYDVTKETRSGIERLIFYGDGLKMIKDRWFLGWGGGAWKVANYAYQSYLYTSSETHSYIVQIGVECGLLGVLTLLSLVVAIIALFILEFKYRKKEDINGAIIQTGLITAVAALVMHSWADFDLSLTSIFLLLWVAIALINSRCRQLLYSSSATNVKEKNKSDESADDEVFVNKRLTIVYEKLEFFRRLKGLKMPAAIGLIFSMIIVVFPVSLAMATNYGSQAGVAITNGDNASALKLLKYAMQADPFDPKYKVDYSRLLLSGSGANTQRNLLEASKVIGEAEKLTKYDADICVGLGSFYFNTGNIEKGLYWVNKSLDLLPMNPEIWQSKADVCMQLASMYYQKGDSVNTAKFVDEALKVINDATEVNKRNMVPFKLTPLTDEMLARAVYLKEVVKYQKGFNISSITFFNMPNLDVNHDSIPDQWLADNKSEVSFEVKNSIMTVQSTVPDKTVYVSSRKLGLTAGKQYRVEVELENVQNIKSIPFMLTGVSDKTNELRLQGNVYVASIAVPAEFTAGDNLLKLGINGKYEIKSVKVLEQ